MIYKDYQAEKNCHLKKKQDDFILWFEFAFIAEINKMLLFKMKLFFF